MDSQPLEAKRDAPAFSSASIDIAAPAALVWQIMIRVEEWPKWNPDIKTATLDGPLERGARVVWRSGPGTIRSEIVDLIPVERMSWTGTSLGIHAIHVWKLQSVDGHTRVQTEESWEGLLPRLASGYSRRTLDKALASGLSHLKTEAERRAHDWVADPDVA